MHRVLVPRGRPWAVGGAPALRCGIQAVSPVPTPHPCYPLPVPPGYGYGLAGHFCMCMPSGQPTEAAAFTKPIVKMWSEKSKDC